MNRPRLQTRPAAAAAIVLLLVLLVRGDDLVEPADGCSSGDRLVDAGMLRTMGGIAALACFGDATLTLEGTVRCTPAVRDVGAGGPSWLDPYSSCVMDEALALHGPPVTALLVDGAPPPPNPVAGWYRVRGHFDDPEARTCSWVPIGVSVTSPTGPPDPDAVEACRQLFVVTEIEPLS